MDAEEGPNSVKSGRGDLSEDSAFFLELLDDTRAWRERLVVELGFDSPNHARATSSYQINFPPELLRRHIDLDTTVSANVLLPLTTRPKRPLLHFGLSGPGGSPATLTSRGSIAALQAEYLRDLVEVSPAAAALRPTISNELCEAICLFSPSRFLQHDLTHARGNVELALTQHLGEAFGFRVSQSDVSRWRVDTQAAGAKLLAALDEPAEVASSSEEVLLAIGLLENPPAGVEEVDRLVADYRAGVEAAAGCNDTDFLSVLAEYGRRYELAVEVELPLLEPSRVKVTEELPLGFRAGQWTSHRLPLRDARSVHLEARIDDPSTEIDRFDVKDLAGADAAGWIESVRHTREALALYSSADLQAPYYVEVELRLHAAPNLLWTAGVLILANIGALVAVVNVEETSNLALLALPTTLAAAFTLVREQSTLATRLLRIPRLLLAATALAVWAAVALSLVGDNESGKASPPSSARANIDRGRDDWERISDGKEWSTRERENRRG